MDDYKNSDNFQRTEGCKMISPHHLTPPMGSDPITPFILLDFAGYDPQFLGDGWTFKGRQRIDRRIDVELAE